MKLRSSTIFYHCSDKHEDRVGLVVKYDIHISRNLNCVMNDNVGYK